MLSTELVAEMCVKTGPTTSHLQTGLRDASRNGQTEVFSDGSFTAVPEQTDSPSGKQVPDVRAGNELCSPCYHHSRVSLIAVPLLPRPVCPVGRQCTQTDAVLSRIPPVNRTLWYLGRSGGDLVTHKRKWACRAFLMKAVLPLLCKGLFRGYTLFKAGRLRFWSNSIDPVAKLNPSWIWNWDFIWFSCPLFVK